MGDHARPSRHQTKSEDLGTDKGADNSDHPHANNIEQERLFCLSNALHHAFDDDRKTIERFGKRHHSQDGGSEGNDLFTGRENLDQCRCSKKQRAAGENHQADLNRNKHRCQFFQTFFILGTVGVARQCGRRRLHSVARDVKGGFDGVCDGMRRCGYLAEGVDHGREGHITEGCSESLEHVRECHSKAWL